MPRRVTRRGNDPDPLDRFMVTGHQVIVGAGRVDPLEDRVVRRVRDLPLGRLDIDRDPRECAVLTGVVDVQVAVHDGRHVGCREADVGERVADPSRLDPVASVQSVVAEAEPRVEQEDALRMADGVGDDGADLAGERLVGRESESGQVEGQDVLGLDHRVVSLPSTIRTRMSRRGEACPGSAWRRGRDSNPRRVAPNRISSAAP